MSQAEYENDKIAGYIADHLNYLYNTTAEDVAFTDAKQALREVLRESGELTRRQARWAYYQLEHAN